MSRPPGLIESKQGLKENAQDKRGLVLLATLDSINALTPFDLLQDDPNCLPAAPGRYVVCARGV